MRYTLSLVLFALTVVSGSGCTGALGSYFANRGRDFGHCWRAEVGLGTGVGGGASVLGVVDAGLGGGGLLRRGSLGWDYGGWHAFGALSLHPKRADRAGSSPDKAWIATELFIPAANVFGAALGGPQGAWTLHASSSVGPTETHLCAGLLPSLTGTESTPGSSRWLHLFDANVAVYAGVIGVRVGFSPGEFLDFLLGWFGLDIAGDDTPASPPEPSAPSG